MKESDRFERLLGVLEKLEGDEFGTWIVDNEHKGTHDDPIQVPYPVYTEAVDELIDAVYEFADNNPDFDLYNYYEVLQKRNISEPENTDLEKLDEIGVMALLMSIIRKERFSDGEVLEKLENGNIQRLLRRLKQE